jgi:hypothetical protein
VELAQIVIPDESSSQTIPPDVSTFASTSTLGGPPSAPSPCHKRDQRSFGAVFWGHRLRAALVCGIVVLFMIQLNDRRLPKLGGSVVDQTDLIQTKELRVSSVMFDPAKSDFSVPDDIQKLLLETLKVQYEVVAKADKQAQNVELCVSAPSDVIYLSSGTFGNSAAEIRWMRPRRKKFESGDLDEPCLA